MHCHSASGGSIADRRQEQSRASKRVTVPTRMPASPTGPSAPGSVAYRDANDCGRPPSRARRLAPSPPAGSVHQVAGLRNRRGMRFSLLAAAGARERLLPWLPPSGTAHAAWKMRQALASTRRRSNLALPHLCGTKAAYERFTSGVRARERASARASGAY
jgi:hypothetical protein